MLAHSLLYANYSEICACFLHSVWIKEVLIFYSRSYYILLYTYVGRWWGFFSLFLDIAVCIARLPNLIHVHRKKVVHAPLHSIENIIYIRKFLNCQHLVATSQVLRRHGDNVFMF